MKNKQHTIVKKFVLSRDRLPVNFPHYLVIYLLLINNGLHWNIWSVLASSLVLLITLAGYAYRKTLEVPVKDK